VNYLYGLNLRAEPDAGSELLIFLPFETIVVVLDGREFTDERTWQQVQYGELVGWTLEEFLR